MRDSNAREGLSLSFRKIEKARKARMMTPPTVPPTMRIVFVFALLLEEVEDAAVADDVLEVVGLPDMAVSVESGESEELVLPVVVGLGSKEGLVMEESAAEAVTVLACPVCVCCCCCCGCCVVCGD
jgi:hypothetical protein